MHMHGLRIVLLIQTSNRFCVDFFFISGFVIFPLPKVVCVLYIVKNSIILFHEYCNHNDLSHYLKCVKGLFVLIIIIF